MKVTVYDETTINGKVLFESDIDKYIVNSSGMTDFVLDDKIVLSLEWTPGVQPYNDYVSYLGQLASVNLQYDDV